MFDIPLHKLVVHFPIALTVFAFAYDCWAVSAKRPELHDTGYGISLWATVSAMLAVVTGLQIASLGEIGKDAITGHALYGISAAIVMAAFGLWRYSSRARQEGLSEKYSTLWVFIQGLAALLVIAAAITGHRLF
jgi:uncharacterized membrane protein